MTERYGRIALILISSLFVVAIGHAAARLTWTLAGQTGAEVTDIASALAAPTPDRSIDVAPILALAPFGQTTVATVSTVAVKETALGLVLRGAAVADRSQDSIAVIASGSSPAKLYGVDDTIDGKAILREIKSDMVLLDVGGRIETLSFPKPNPTTATSGVDMLALGIANSGATSGAGATASQPKASGLEEIRRKIQQNPKSLLDSYGISASAEGYHIDPNATSSVLRAGFRPGDVIAKVNGEALGDIERDRRLLDTVIASGRVRIEVMREGRTVVMSFPLQ